MSETRTYWGIQTGLVNLTWSASRIHRHSQGFSRAKLAELGLVGTAAAETSHLQIVVSILFIYIILKAGL